MNNKNCGTINRESMVVHKQHSSPQSIINYGTVQPSGNKQWLYSLLAY